jgi:hypothetical protein
MTAARSPTTAETVIPRRTQEQSAEVAEAVAEPEVRAAAEEAAAAEEEAEEEAAADRVMPFRAESRPRRFVLAQCRSSR